MKQVSVTITTTDEIKQAAMNYSLQLGLVRNQSGVEVGDLTKGMGHMLAYAMANMDLVEKFRTDKVQKALAQSGTKNKTAIKKGVK